MREFLRNGDLTTYTSGISGVDRTMCCAFCGQRLNSVVLADSGRTEIRCGSCDACSKTPVSRTATPISRN
jgi:transcription elongation factor Elf1